MTEAKIKLLKKKIQHPNDWDQALHYFLGQFAPDKQLFGRSQKVRIPIFQEMVGQICVEVFKKSPIPLVALSVFRIKDIGLIHGSCYAEGKHILFLYFTDLHKGVFGISQAGYLIHATRITALPSKELEKMEVIYEAEFDGRMN